jgi:gas vesicle protein
MLTYTHTYTHHHHHNNNNNNNNNNKQVLEEIADAQLQMCENLEVSLSQSLEAFRGTQVQEVTALQAEADQMTDAAEQSFAKYLNGRQYASEDNVGSWNKLSEQVLEWLFQDVARFCRFDPLPTWQ